MDWINSISNMDNTINEICIKDSCLIIYIKTWDQKIRQIIFSDYYAFKGKNSIGREIGDIIIQTNSIFSIFSAKISNRIISFQES